VNIRRYTFSDPASRRAETNVLVSLVVLATAGGALFCCKNSPEPGPDAALDSGVDGGRREAGTFTLDGGTVRDGSLPISFCPDGSGARRRRNRGSR
jgi:hypothetical protein